MMNLLSIKRKLSSVMAALLVVSYVQLFAPADAVNVASAAEDGPEQTFPISLQINNMDSATNATGDTVGTAGIAVVANSDPDYIKEGTGSKKWLLSYVPDPTNPDVYDNGAALIYPKQAPNVDLNGYSTLKFWAYSMKARTGDQAEKQMLVRFYMKGDSQYYSYRLSLDWTGWKEIEIPLQTVKSQASDSATIKPWGPLDYIRFDRAASSGTNHDPELQIYLDDMRLTNTAEVYPAASDKPSGEYKNKVTLHLSSLSQPSVLTSVYYKREGVDSDFQLYSAPLTLTEDTTLITKASINGVDSSETTYNYTFIYGEFVENAIVDLPAGTYAEEKTVTLSSETAGASLFYKFEGEDNDFKPYTEPIVLDHPVTLVTKAVYNDISSDEVSYSYNIDLSGSSSIPISDMENFTGWTNTTPTTHQAVLGQKSGLWTDPTSAINVTGFNAPWDENDQIEFWLYSDKVSYKKIYFILEANIPDPGFDYFMSTITVDWTGWKKIELPFNKFLNSTGLADLANFHQIIIHPNWYDSENPDPTDKLYFDGMAVTKNAVEPSINKIDKSALPDSTLHYSFSLKNIGNADTAYGIAPKTAFPAGYEVSYDTMTAVVAQGEETDVDIEVKVPEGAAAGDSKQAVFTVTPLQGGKQTNIELNVKVGSPRVPAKQHPYVMVSQAQLDAAKEKVATYDWAQDYLDAIQLKADAWVDKTVYYPSKPGGESSLYTCGDTPLVFEYDKPHEHLCPDDDTYHTGDDLDAAWRFTAHTVNIEAARNLALVYALTGEEKYAAKAKEILMNYAALYPSYPLQALNGRLYYQSLDEAVQMIELVQAYDLVEPSGLFTISEQYDLEQNLFAPSAKTLQGYDVGKSNWQTWHNAAIGAVGALLEDQALMDFSVKGKSGFEFQMANSVLSDGFWYEGAIGYHFYAQSALLYHAQALKNSGYDLFANPNFKKTFDVTLQYAFPDLGIINSNDSGKYPTSLAAPGRVVPKDYEEVFAEYNDPAYGALLDTLYNDKQRPRGGFVIPGDINSGIVGEEAVFYGEEMIPTGGSLPSDSYNFTGLGHSVLRAGTGDDQLYALVDYGIHGGYHGHPDELHLEVFGKGERLAPDPGIPPYSNSMYESYYKKTFAHNTVAIDGKTQNVEAEMEVNEPTKLFLTSEPFNIMTNTSSKAYANMNRYERTVAVTKDYMIDLFSVESDTERTFDWIMHGLGDFTLGTDMSLYEETLGTEDAYSFFRNGQVADVNGAWEGQWKKESGNGLKLFSLTSSAEHPSEMIVGEAPGPANDTSKYMPTLVNRVEGTEAQFVSLLEPFNGTSQIESVEKTGAGQIEVNLKDGRTQVFYYNSGVESAGKLQYYYMDGKNYGAEDVEVTAELEGDVLTLTSSEPADLISASIVVYAPEASTVMWNGEEADFTSNNGFVMVSASDESAEEPGDGDGGDGGDTDNNGGDNGNDDGNGNGNSNGNGGGGTGTTNPSSNAGKIEKEVPVGSNAQLSLGNNEFVVNIPAGSMGEVVKYVVEKLSDANVLSTILKGRKDVLSSVFEVKKDKEGLFSVPIKLRFKFDPSKLEEGQIASVYYYDEDAGEWIPMGGTVDGDYIEVESNHLTKFAVLAAEAPEEETTELTDIDGHWAQADIEAAVEAGIVHGYTDGSFHPDQSVTREEFSVMLMNALQPEGKASQELAYTDASTISDWAAVAVALASEAYIVSGFEDGSFRPGQQMTRAQLAVMLANVLEDGEQTADGTSSNNDSMIFSDASAIPMWAVQATVRVKEAGLMIGRSGNKFVPSGIVTRAEAATVIMRLLEEQLGK
ncbi:S-layer homology domain-containing protein [Paenibacillus sp. HB172176]|uniref:S-layer homology domain-containing protein n=1 Tax=Paenibacillus sp. HB172176 TaxID=2493690 RepID=UPI0019813611|nr:S-layer homology domain-containing protein [Paenibacillus sp. HB172176]